MFLALTPSATRAAKKTLLRSAATSRAYSANQVTTFLQRSTMFPVKAAFPAGGAKVSFTNAYLYDTKRFAQFGKKKRMNRCSSNPGLSSQKTSRFGTAIAKAL